MRKESENTQKQVINYASMTTNELTETIDSLVAENTELKQQLSNLMNMIRLNNSQKYGASADAVSYPEGYEQLSFFNEPEKYGRADEPEPSFESATSKASRKAKEVGKKARDLDGLKVTVIEHTLPEEEQVCGICGGNLHEMKVEITRLLKLVPAHFEVEEHRKSVYTCRSCEHNQGEDDKLPFIHADMKAIPISGSFASPELLGGIINSKYVNHMPLSRIEKEFKRVDSVEISRQTMSNWMLKVSDLYFMPLAQHMKETLLSHDVLHADETYCTVAFEDGRESKKKCFMWVYCSSKYEIPIVYYEYHTTRAQEAAEAFLSGYQGILHTDGYQVYHALSEEITVVGCLSHIQRKYTDGIKSLSEAEKKNTYCYRGLEYCEALFSVEKRLKNLEPEEIYRKRQVELKPIMDAFYEWTSENFPKTVPDSPAYKAMQYTLNQWPYFKNILLDGRIEATNNKAERSIRPFAQGRRNWMTIKTNRGGASSAAIYSVVQTALANDLKVYEYLTYLFQEMPSENFILNPDAIKKYMPWSKELPRQCYKKQK